MSDHHVPAAIGMGVLVVVLLLRLPAAIRQPSSRLAWLATLTGCAAMSTVGVIAPLDDVDALLGASNYINLAQNVLATVAFWLLMQATLTLDGSPFDPRAAWELPAVLLAFTVPFLLIPDRGPTSGNFIVEQAHKPALWAYASIYMLCVATIMWRLLLHIRGRQPRLYVLMRIGAGAVILASLVEVAYLTLRVTKIGDRSWVDLLSDSFVPLFYGGVVLVAIGIGGFAAARGARRTILRLLGFLLRCANRAHGLGTIRLDAGDTAHETYQLAVRLADVANSEPLSWSERVLLLTTSRLLDYHVRAPEVVRLASDDRALESAAAG